MGKPKVDTSDIFISYHVNGQPQLEYIPPAYNKLEDKYFDLKLRYLEYAGAPTYYWQYRHFLTPTLRKIEDIKFLIHVYEQHDFAPTDRVEKRHFRNAWNLYHQEFETLIRPKIDQEKEGHGIIHQYALAYYKRWLKPINPNFTRMYHGVHQYEMLEMYDELLSTMKKDNDSSKYRLQYYDAKARLHLKKNPPEIKKSKKEIDEKKELELSKYKEFRMTYWAIDCILSYIFFVSIFQMSGVERPFWDSLFMFIGFAVFLQLVFVPIFFAIKFTKYQHIQK